MKLLIGTCSLFKTALSIVNCCILRVDRYIRYLRYLVFCMSCGGHNKPARGHRCPVRAGVVYWCMLCRLLLASCSPGQRSHGRLLTTPPTATGLPSFQSPVPQYKMCKTLQRFSIPFNTQQSGSWQGFCFTVV